MQHSQESVASTTLFLTASDIDPSTFTWLVHTEEQKNFGGILIETNKQASKEMQLIYRKNCNIYSVLQCL